MVTVTKPVDSSSKIKEATDVFIATRYRIFSDFRFFGSLLMRHCLCFDERVPTACVTANDRLIINPSFFLSLNQRQRLFLICHEVLHPALGFFWRSMNHEPERANVAHDFVINLLLVADTRLELIPGCLFNHDLKGLGYEEVYALLKSNEMVVLAPAKGKGENPLKGDTCLDDPFPDAQRVKIAGNPEPTPAPRTKDEFQARAKEWEVRVKEALISARICGQLPAGLSSYFEVHGSPTVPWQEVLRYRLAEDRNLSGLDWSNPSRRGTSLGIYMPREIGKVPDVALYIDTSGSVSDDQLEAVLVEVHGIARNAGVRLHILAGDAEIHQHDFTSRPPSELRGGGGTSFVPVFNFLSANRGVAKTLVVFTDTWGEMPQKPPHGVKVLWCVFSSAIAQGVSVPFGEIIPLRGV